MITYTTLRIYLASDPTDEVYNDRIDMTGRNAYELLWWSAYRDGYDSPEYVWVWGEERRAPDGHFFETP